MTPTPEQREALSKDAIGKQIESMTWDEVDEYWVMAFTDGSEMCVRGRIELVEKNGG